MERILPLINACLNLLSLIFLVMGLIQIKKKNQLLHKKLMITAFICSSLFLLSYLLYHYNYENSICIVKDWRRTLYFFLLIPHIILAILMLPLILITFFYAFKNKFAKHRWLAKITFPIWIYVSLTGVIIYFYIYIIFPEIFKKKSLITLYNEQQK